MSQAITFSVIIPARNEETLIRESLHSVLVSIARFCGSDYRLLPLAQTPGEVIVVDNLSTDRTAEGIRKFRDRYGVRYEVCPRIKAASARNHGVQCARGRLLIFLDADTLMPPDGICRVWELTNRSGYEAGIFRLAPQEWGIRPWLWWTFWEQVRRLPLAKAKAMPAFMFCLRAIFDHWGPFDERVAIGEEWPILANAYRASPEKFIYDRSIVARTSSRRMTMRPFGYTRNFFKYIWAIADLRGRIDYPDFYRHPLKEKLE